CARSTRTHGQEVFGCTGLAPTSRSGTVRVQQKCVGWNLAKPDDTWPDPRRRGNCPVAPAHQVPNPVQLYDCLFTKADPVAFSFADGQDNPCRRALPKNSGRAGKPKQATRDAKGRSPVTRAAGTNRAFHKLKCTFAHRPAKGASVWSSGCRAMPSQ